MNATSDSNGLIPAWIDNYVHYKMLDEITYPFPNFNGWTVEVWECINNFIPNFNGHVVTYPCGDYSYSMLVKWVPVVKGAKLNKAK